MSMPANWYPDPDGGHGRIRWWDGAQWTEQTSTTATPAGWLPDPTYGPGQLRWWDGVRFTEHTAPAPMGPSRTGRAYRPTRVLGGFALGTALLVVVVQLAVAVSVGSSFDRIQQAAYAGDDLDSLFTAYDVLGYLFFVALLLAWLVNAAWLHTVRLNAEALAPESPHVRRAGWAWGAWVCPIVSFWFPYQVVRDVTDATRARAPRGLLGWWWAAFLVMTFFPRIVDSTRSDLLEDPDVTWDSAVSTVQGLEIASLVITALAAAAWLMVIRRIQADQDVAAAVRAPRSPSSEGRPPVH